MSARRSRLFLSTGMLPVLRWLWMSLFSYSFVYGCHHPDTAHCDVEKRMHDGKQQWSCVERTNVESDAFERLQTDCETMPRLEEIVVATNFDEGLCRREGIVGGCATNEAPEVRVWLYPNAEGYPSASELEEICSVVDLDVIPPP